MPTQATGNDFARADELVDWFHLHPELSQRARSPQKSEAAEVFTNHLWPLSIEYHSPLKPRFLIEFEKGGLQDSTESILVRDGLVPLLWYWRQFPTPGKFAGKLMIASGLERFAPPAWLNRVVPYRLVSTVGEEKTVERYLLLGLAMPGFSTLEALRSKLELIKKSLRDSRKRPSIEILMPVRFGRRDDPKLEFHFEFIQEVIRALGTEVVPINLTILQGRDSYVGTKVVDLSDGMLIKDGFPSHLALSRGATLFDGPQAGTAGWELTRLSPFHGCELRLSKPLETAASPKAAPADELYLTSVAEAMGLMASHIFPWPLWFEEMARSR